MKLLFEDSDTEGHARASISKEKLANVQLHVPQLSIGDLTPTQTLRGFRSQPQLNSDQKRRRRFSFEPGEDHLRAWKEESTANEISRSPHHLSASNPSLSRDSPGTSAPSTPNGWIQSHDTSNLESHSASKIPSPLQAFGNVRRKTSISSLKSTTARSKDGRNNSRSSILTAYRDDQNSKLRPTSSSRGSSRTTSHRTRTSSSTKNHARSIHGHHSVDDKSPEHANHRRTSQGGSPARGNAKPSVADQASPANRKVGALGHVKDKPSDCG